MMGVKLSVTPIIFAQGCSRENSILQGEDCKMEEQSDDEWKLFWSSDEEDASRDDSGGVGLDLLNCSEFISVSQVMISS